MIHNFCRLTFFIKVKLPSQADVLISLNKNCKLPWDDNNNYVICVVYKYTFIHIYCRKAAWVFLKVWNTPSTYRKKPTDMKTPLYLLSRNFASELSSKCQGQVQSELDCHLSIAATNEAGLATICGLLFAPLHVYHKARARSVHCNFIQNKWVGR